MLHICCAPCLYASYNVLEAENFEVIGFFYNPNIHGRSEYEKRLKDVSSLASKLKIELITPPYNIQEFFKPILPFQNKQSIKFISDMTRFNKKRCHICYDIRLQATVKEAKIRRLKYYSSTLLVSPFRNHSEIVELAMDLGMEKKINYFYRDFRKGYYKGRNLAKAQNFHLPSYCGCTFSIEEKILE